MRVEHCKSCKHCERRVWSSSYKPANYHAVGVSHAYRYCTFHDARCLSVRQCTNWEEDKQHDDV